MQEAAQQHSLVSVELHTPVSVHMTERLGREGGWLHSLYSLPWEIAGTEVAAGIPGAARSHLDHTRRQEVD